MFNHSLHSLPPVPPPPPQAHFPLPRLSRRLCCCCGHQVTQQHPLITRLFHPALIDPLPLLFPSPSPFPSEHHVEDSGGEFFFGGTAGCMFAASSFIVRAATAAPKPLRLAATLTGLCMSVFGVLLQGRGLRDGRSIIIIAWTNAIATMVAMISGHLVLLEAMPSDVLGMMLRFAATCLILAGIVASAVRLEPPAVLVSAVRPPPPLHLLMLLLQVFVHPTRVASRIFRRSRQGTRCCLSWPP